MRISISIEEKKNKLSCETTLNHDDDDQFIAKYTNEQTIRQLTEKKTY